MKKFFAIIIIVCIASSQAFTAIAAPNTNTSMNEVVFELTSLGVVRGDENGDINISKYITRAEFIRLILNLEGLNQSTGYNQASKYSDVPSGYWAESDIMFATDAGICTGFPDGTFKPDDQILLQDCIKIIVGRLGYDIYANELGGYPNGYLAVARKHMDLNGVSSKFDTPATFGDILQLIYNSLDVKKLKPENYGESGKYVESDETFRTVLTSVKKLNVHKGIVTADTNTWLVKPLPDLKDEEVELDGYIYQKGNTNVADYIGMEVLIYYFEDVNTGKLTIINAVPTNRNQVNLIKAEDVSGYINGRIEYTKNDKIAYEKTDKNTSFIYNGRLVINKNDSEINDLLTFPNGSIKSIDNNGDGGNDYVLISSYEDAVVEKTYENGRIQFKNVFKIDNKQFIVLDDTENMNYKIVDKNGKDIPINDIKPDDVISMYISTDKLQVTAIVSNATINGAITEKNAVHGIFIGDKWYTVSDEKILKNIELGKEQTFLLNHEEKIVFFKDSEDKKSEYKYGYLYRTAKSGNFGEYEVQIIDGKQIRSEEETNESNKDDKNKIPVLVCQNEGVSSYSLKEKVRVDNVSMSAEEFSNLFIQKPIKYQVNKDGEISNIETLEISGGRPGRDIKYNAYDKVFGGYEDMGGFAISEDTISVCVPLNTDASGNDFSVQVKIDNKDTSRTYKAQGYEFDEITKTVKVIVISEIMSADDILNIVPETGKIGMVVESATALDDEGNNIRKTTLLINKKEEILLSENITSDNADIEKLATGDIIYYSKNNNGLMDNAKIISSLKHENESIKYGDGQSVEYIYGYVDDIVMNELDVRGNSKVHKMVMNIDNGKQETVLISARNLPPIYVYSKQGVTSGGIEDIMPFNGNGESSSKVFVIRTNSK
ncbi:MAG: S-layer homology domain-containing protein, partial [Oscillospiraceae bacterium]